MKILIMSCAAAFVAGSMIGARFLSKPCGDCVCAPPPCPAAVSISPFDVSKFNNKRGSFTYSPQLHNVTVVLDCEDSVMVRSIRSKANTH